MYKDVDIVSNKKLQSSAVCNSDCIDCDYGYEVQIAVSYVAMTQKLCFMQLVHLHAYHLSNILSL